MHRTVDGGKAAPAGAAPTGCFKCGRPGHWSRDCPFSSATTAAAASAADPIAKTNPSSSSSYKSSDQVPSWKPTAVAKVAAAKKPPRTRPKLTPDLLLSDDGLGYVLRHFPRAFKYRGRGHEVADLGNLISMYAQWHAHLIPYYSYDQFVRKVEKVGATKRVRRCLSELKDRVARGGDPTKLHEPPVEETVPENEPAEGTTNWESNADAAEPISGTCDAVDVTEQMFDEIYHKATEEPWQSSPQEAHKASDSQGTFVDSDQTQLVDHSTISMPTKIQITEEQKARMEANRLKALEKAKARRASQGS